MIIVNVKAVKGFLPISKYKSGKCVGIKTNIDMVLICVTFTWLLTVVDIYNFFGK